MVRAYSKVRNPRYRKILVSVSGGADSDAVVDIIEKVRDPEDKDQEVEYVYFDTGLEYQATKEHLTDLEKRYGIQIDRRRAIKPIPTCCKQYGEPFISKQVSEWIQRLQAHNFKWEDKDFEILLAQYPKCKAALRWWCNKWGSKSRFNISYNKWLKEFMIENPPDFKISNQCCHYAKKLLAARIKKERDCDLSVVGVRKAEGGARASAYKNCFSSCEGGSDEYRPLFFYTNTDRKQYDEHFGIIHSRCYTEYGLKRTGCAGCPFGNDFEEELRIMEENEPRLFHAVNNIFGNSYRYTRMYRQYAKQRNTDI